MNIQNYKDEAINQLNEEILELNSQINLIKNLDTSSPIDETVWHEICKTPLRCSREFLSKLILTIFPNAGDIEISPNRVCFSLYGYKIFIPTTWQKGIAISTDWYKNIELIKTLAPPIVYENDRRMKEYFYAVDNKLGWKAEAKARAVHGKNYSDIKLFFWWFGKRKWTKVDRDSWEEKWKEQEEKRKAREKELSKMKEENEKHISFIKETLLPELNKFSTIHIKYPSSLNNIDEIL